MNLKTFIKKPFFLLSLGYLLTRCINLLKLPIFNDESIYIDWGTREISTKGLAFYSLFDGKPPLLMWIFGLLHKLISDPLLAGRIVSVFAGFLTMFGIYKLAKRYFGERTAAFATVFYIIIPIFVFFDRQALMEASLSAIGVWSLYYFLDFVRKPGIKNAVILGALWGVGIFIKQSALVFIIAETLLYIWLHIKKHGQNFSLFILLIFFVSQLVLCPLYFQKDFWTSLSSGARFAMSFEKILSFPISDWLNNARGILMIPFWYFSPLIFILAVVGIFLVKEKSQKLMSAYFLVGIFIVLIFSITVSPRYLVAYLPLMTIFAARAFHGFRPKARILKSLLLFILIIYPLIGSGLLVFTPIKYFETLKSITSYSQEEGYVSDWTSGYATSDAIQFIKNVSSATPVVVGVRLDAGNPESAVFAYFNRSKKVLPVYFDSRAVDKSIFGYDCLLANYPFYFVARDDIQAGMDKFLTKVAEFRNPLGERFVAIYTLKTGCGKNTLTVKF